MSQHTAKHEELAAVLPLEPGDRLTRPEFERRYDATPGLKKAELVEGVVYVPSPVRLNRHARPHAKMGIWLAVYELGTPGVEICDNATVRMDRDNEPQPDLILRIADDARGQSRTDEDDYLKGAPELIVEVASSSASYDLGVKKNAYRRNGVREYVVWRVFDRTIDWFVLRDDAYVHLEPGRDGVVRSLVFPGLWLDPAAMLEDRMSDMEAVVRMGLASPEHLAFMARLAPTV